MTSWEIVFGMVTALGAGSIITYQWKNWFPSKADKSKTENDLTNTIKTAIDINDQLNVQLKELVEEKTQGLQNILLRREGEYHLQIANYSRTIFDYQEKDKVLQQELAKVRAESVEYQKQILLCYNSLAEERRLKDQTLEELEDAKKHIDELEKRVVQLERINKI